jgi:tetratricopeptide (TPR) repeat protein
MAHPLAVRVGLHVGEPVVDEDDYFGISVNIAKRLCDSAEAGQIIASDVVRQLAEPRVERCFRALGALAIRGVREPLPSVEVLWRATPSSPPPPPALTTADALPFVGRDEAMRRLAGAWEQVRHGARRLVLLHGEPGVGKTRLAAEFSSAARDHGATVLYGRCDEEALLPYQPFVEALRHYVRHAPIMDLRIAARNGAGEVARLVPELHDRIPGLPTAWVDHPDTEQYRLFEAVVAMLGQASLAAPLLLVLDDLHWADRPSLHLLRHVSRAPDISSMLVLGTYRDGEVDRSDPLAETLVELRRLHRLQRIALSGLDRPSTATLVAALSGSGSTEAFLNCVHAATEGNPFFVEELVRHLAEVHAGVAGVESCPWSDRSFDEVGIPDGVREVIGRRLARLSAACCSFLTQASVLGREFPFALLPEVTGMTGETLLDALEEAVRRRVLVEVGGRSEAVYAFPHALVRETLYADLSLPRRQQAHWRAAQAIHRRREREEGGDALEVAIHCRLSGPVAEPGLLIEAAWRAGDAAAAVYAWKEAVLHWETALHAMERTGAEAPARARLLRRLGGAMFTSNLDHSRGAGCFEQALELFQQTGDELGAAKMHAHLAGQYAAHPAMVDTHRAERHLAAAAPVLSREPQSTSCGHLRVLESILAMWKLRSVDGLESSHEAMTIAEHAGDIPLWANAAGVHGWHLAAMGRLREGRELMTLAWERAHAAPHHLSAFMATVLLCGIDTICRRDVASSVRWVERELASQRALRGPVHRSVLLSALGYALALGGSHRRVEQYVPAQSSQFHVEYLVRLGAGRWEDALDFLEAAHRRAGDLGNRWYQAAEACRMGGVLRLLDRPAEAERILRSALPDGARGEGHVPLELWCRAQLALLLGEAGRRGEARRELARCGEILTNGEDWHGLAATVALAEAVVCAVEGRADDADRLFTSVAAMLREQRLPWDEAEALHLHGRMLLAQGDAQRARSREILDASYRLYDSLTAGSRWHRRVRSTVTDVVLTGRVVRPDGVRRLAAAQRDR